MLCSAKDSIPLSLKAQTKNSKSPGYHKLIAEDLNEISKHMHTCGYEMLINLLKRTLSLGRFGEQRQCCDAGLDMTV